MATLSQRLMSLRSAVITDRTNDRVISGMQEYRRDWDAVDQLIGAMWRSSSPAGLFHNAYVAYNYHGSLGFNETIAITDISGDPEALARGQAYADWLKPRLAVHEGFVALQRHWAAMRVSGHYCGDDGYGGHAINWCISVPADSLPLLEALAQEDAGFLSPDERAAAALDFRTYMARNFDKNSEENRKVMPTIDQTPYLRRL